jgi:hypothetical protein
MLRPIRTRQGIEATLRGDGRPAADVLEEIRAKHGIPKAE